MKNMDLSKYQLRKEQLSGELIGRCNNFRYGRMASILTIVIACVFCLAFVFKQNGITVYLIGDSTMANKPAEVWPETGWGMPFSIFFDSTAIVDNRAKNGRSTKSFIAENLWQPVSDNLESGDYVLIQFGHNDEVKEKVGRYTTPEEFKTNLARFVTETRAKNAHPILITPVTRRRFDENGVVLGSHEVYSQVVRDLAAELDVPLIDLDKKSQELLQQFGPEFSKYLYMQLKPGEHPNYPNGRDDNTHFTEFGARLMAQLVLSGIKDLDIELADRIVNSD